VDVDVGVDVAMMGAHFEIESGGFQILDSEQVSLLYSSQNDVG